MVTDFFTVKNKVTARRRKGGFYETNVASGPLRARSHCEGLVKAHLVFKLDGIRKGRGLSQTDAAAWLGVRQPDVSKMLRGDFRQFSVERLLRFMVA